MTEEKILEAQEEFERETPEMPKESYDRQAAFRKSIARHYESLIEQAEELKKEFPDFDLIKALENREILRLTAPMVGVSLRGAYYAANAKELNERSARKAAEETKRLAAKSIAAGAGRPMESRGLSSAPAFGPQGGELSRENREKLKQDIRTAAARGEKIYIR